MLALDLRVSVDQARDGPALGEFDREPAVGEPEDLAGVLVAVFDAVAVAVVVLRVHAVAALVAVLDAVVVGIVVARVGLGPKLAEVVEPVVVLVATGLLDPQAEAVAALPAVRDAVAVAVG